MVAPSPENLEWIRHIHLFHDLPDEVLVAFLEALESRPFQAGDVVARAGEACHGLCFVRRGRVELFRPVGKMLEEAEDLPLEKTSKRVGVLVSRDYWGEECVLEEDYPTFEYTGRALDAGEVYCWPLEAVGEVVAQYRDIWEFLSLVQRSRRRIRRKRPSWIPADEMVYLLLGRPPIALVPRTWWLLLAGAVAAALLVAGSVNGSTLLMGVGGVIGLLILPGLAWEFEDWRNDYCVVTNRRVAWVDKIVFLYESRNEASLESVLSVHVRTDWWGRLLHYGDVIVRTYAGKIIISEVAFPYVVAALVEEYWQRARSHVRRQSEEELRHMVMERLGKLPPASENQAQGGTVASGVQRTEGWLPRMLRKYTRWLKQRVEENGTVTYRKHWFLLLRRGGFQGLLLVAWWVLAVAGWMAFPHVVNAAMWWGVAVLVGLGLAIWFGYEIWDWSNDIYQLTPEHIIDIYRKPFGSEDKQSAPLESIENMTYQRRGFLGWLFNFGDVEIRVGTTTMIFEGVARPDMVQQEIFHYMERRRRQKEAADTQRESDHMLRLLKAFYEITMEEGGPPLPERPESEV